jgi:hypothetical protein
VSQQCGLTDIFGEIGSVAIGVVESEALIWNDAVFVAQFVAMAAWK